VTIFDRELIVLARHTRSPRTLGRSSKALLATMLIVGAGVVAVPGADGEAGTLPVPAAAVKSTGSHTVTLITGDRVTFASAGGQRMSVRAGKGRAGMRFAIERTGGGVYVIPIDAQPLVQAGTVDRRLFDVTGLVKAGYQDEARDTLPLIVQYDQAGPARATLAAGRAEITRDLPGMNGAAVAAGKHDVSLLWTRIVATGDGVRKVWLDGRRQLSLDHSVPQIGAPAAWEAGYTGRGVTVAVLDTGVDVNHPDLTGRVAEAVNFTEEEPGDRDGHGTHVASIIAGSGAASGGRYRGVAPAADLVSGKVCGIGGCAESAVLAGMHWAAAKKKVDVVNLSLGGPDLPGVDPLEEAVETLSKEHGTLFVIAAGNEGASGTVGSPGSADAALTVGAVDRSDALADFSSQGPRVGDDAVKPDVTAPGVQIVAARAAGTGQGATVEESYAAYSGTSMASPHVAGAAALLAQQHPDWTGERLKATLMASAAPSAGLSAYQQGAGRIDVSRAAVQTVTSDPASASFGRQVWPHDDGPVTRTVTYRNAGDADVTLALALSVAGPDGIAAAAGMFTTSADRVTVPAGGQAQVTVTADPSAVGPVGLYSGAMVAVAGSTRVVTPIGVHKEPESYDLTVKFLDHDGSPTPNAFPRVIGWDEPVWSWLTVSADGASIVRLPKGRYNLGAYIETEQGTALLTQPVVELTRNLSITFDARVAKPVSMTVPEPSARLGFAEAGYMFYRSFESPESGMTTGADSFDRVLMAQIGDPAAPDELVGMVAAQWARSDGAGDFTDSPYLYAVAEAFPGRMPTGFVKNYRTKDLAAVRQRFAAGPPGQSALRTVFPSFTPFVEASGLVVPTSLPSTRVEYHNTNNDVRWTSNLAVGTRADDGFFAQQGTLHQGPTAYKAGRTYRDEWYAGPIGPAFGQAGYVPWARRTGDTLSFDLPLYGDRAGHAGMDFHTETSRTALYRNGILVGESSRSGTGSFDVPAEAAGYRLEVLDARGGDLTTKVEAVWTFRSDHANGAAPVRLPLPAVRFMPALDANNAAPADRAFAIPVTVEAQAGTTAAKVKQLTVDVSYDDGATWSKAALAAARGGWIAMVRHPREGAFVSLRASATDATGNTVRQTIIHAYRLTAVPR
jgi:subtilisin family serine protease